MATGRSSESRDTISGFIKKSYFLLSTRQAMYFVAPSSRICNPAFQAICRILPATWDSKSRLVLTTLSNQLQNLHVRARNLRLKQVWNCIGILNKSGIPNTQPLDNKSQI